MARSKIQVAYFEFNNTAPSPRVSNSGGIQAGTVDTGLVKVFRHRLHHFCSMRGKF